MGTLPHLIDESLGNFYALLVHIFVIRSILMLFILRVQVYILEMKISLKQFPIGINKILSIEIKFTGHIVVILDH
jgi:hypothetical protein